MAWRKILLLLSHQEQFLTSGGPMKTWFDRARSMESDPRVLQASNYPMQPWLDVTEGGWATIVVTDNDHELAETLADELADLAWSLRDDFQVKDAVPVDVAVRMADAAETGIVVLSDTGDTVFGGSSGDSNLILEAILRHFSHQGQGASPDDFTAGRWRGWLRPGARARRLRCRWAAAPQQHLPNPIEVTGTVRKIGGGVVESWEYNHQNHVDRGRTVVFEVGPVTMLISELRGIAGNVPEVYLGIRRGTDGV